MAQRTLLDFVQKKSTTLPPVVVDADAVSVDQDDDNPRPRPQKRLLDEVTNVPAAVCSFKTKFEDEKSVNNGGLTDLIFDLDWRAFLKPLTSTSSFRGIDQFLEKEKTLGKVVLPPRELIFSAFNSTPLNTLKVVLLGQDPYHNIGQAHGLCFSVLPGVRPPPSLVNMYKELEADIPGFRPPSHGYLQRWAEQGVLMINATLTVEAHKANSHAGCGWQAFTDGVIRLLSEKHTRPIVFLLWGGFARKKAALIDCKRHIIIESAHPSPLSVAKWRGSRPFSKCNVALQKLGHSPIDWSLPSLV